MATLMTCQELAAIDQRAAAARRGPWKSWIEGRDHWGGSNIITVSDDSADIEMLGATVEDQDFMAAARSDIPALLNEVRELRTRLGLDVF